MALDKADGTEDGVIDLANVQTRASGSYRFVGGDERDQLGRFVSSAGDVDGDGKMDFLIGEPEAEGPRQWCTHWPERLI